MGLLWRAHISFPPKKAQISCGHFRSAFRWERDSAETALPGLCTARLKTLN